jgi:hypothetical protein
MQQRNFYTDKKITGKISQWPAIQGLTVQQWHLWLEAKLLLFHLLISFPYDEL